MISLSCKELTRKNGGTYYLIQTRFSRYEAVVEEEEIILTATGLEIEVPLDTLPKGSYISKICYLIILLELGELEEDSIYHG